MRKNIVAGNWKMNKNFADAEALMLQLLEYKKSNSTNCDVYIAPPALYLTTAKQVFKNAEIGVFAQDVSEYQSGAYTGEISVDMIDSIGIDGSLVSHSERRQYHGETDSHANRKVKALLDAGLTPIYCNGETLEQRKAGQHFEVVKNQTEVALFTLSADEIKKVVIAYEPVWAIGTGKVPTVAEVSATHQHIKQTLASFNAALDNMTVLYGGSVNADNADSFAADSMIDGALVGGASLKAESFLAIAQAFSRAMA